MISAVGWNTHYNYPVHKLFVSETILLYVVLGFNLNYDVADWKPIQKSQTIVGVEKGLNDDIFSLNLNNALFYVPKHFTNKWDNRYTSHLRQFSISYLWLFSITYLNFFFWNSKWVIESNYRRHRSNLPLKSICSLL